MGRETKRAIEGISGSGIAISWKYVLAALAVLLGGGGGGYTVRHFLTEGQVDEKIEVVQTRDDTRHKQLDRIVNGLIVTQGEHSEAIEQVDHTVIQIREVQHRQIARDEARRVTSKIKPRAPREEAYDRIRDVNLSRLKRGAEPCGSIECRN